ncbi:hypothetical protein [Streptomyces sp. NPDC055189]
MNRYWDRDWDGDSGYQEAVEREERLTRFAWSVIGSVAAVFVMAAAVVVLLVMVLLIAFVV